jgi:tRNA G18 (ribose-2'-O)-methylase SpoU
VVSGLGVPSPVIALFRRPPRPSVAELVQRCDRLVIVEAVDNPVNVGSIIRNAAAFGWDGLILDHTSADPFARRSLRVAMGTAFTIPHARTNALTTDLAGLDGVALYALTPAPDATDIRTVTAEGRRGVIVGSERAGLSAGVVRLATPVRIPMAAGVDSLNVAAATAVACFALGG